MMDMNFTTENYILKGQVIPLNSLDIEQALLNNFDQYPNHVWQINAETQKETSFAEMKENTIRCALWLQKQKIGTNDVVASSLPNSENDYIPFIASFYIGAIFNGWEPNTSIERARHYMKLVQPKIIFVSANDVQVTKEAAALENVEVSIIVGDKHPEMPNLNQIMSSLSQAEVDSFQYKSKEDPKSVAMILFTSGTTGFPKGVMYSYEMLAKSFTTSKLSSKPSIGLWSSHLSWISGVYFTLNYIVRRGIRIPYASFENEQTCEIIEKFQVNTVFMHALKLTQLVHSGILKKYRLTSLKTLMTGGIKISNNVIHSIKENLPHTSFFLSYGMTELGGGAASQNEYSRKVESIGFLLPNTQMKVIDVNNGTVLGPNQSGELCFKSARMMLGYYKNPVATKNAIDQEGWLHSEDLGYYDENGEIFIIDRLKELIKNRGYRVSPSEIEDLLLRHSDVAEAAVVRKPHDLYIEEAMAFVKKSLNSKVTAEELIQLSFQSGSEKKLWGGVQFLDEIPHASGGKIDRAYLKELAKSYR